MFKTFCLNNLINQTESEIFLSLNQVFYVSGVYDYLFYQVWHKIFFFQIFITVFLTFHRFPIFLNRAVINFLRSVIYLLYDNIFFFTYCVQVNTSYKQKVQKVHLVNLSVSQSWKPEGSTSWKNDTMKAKRPILGTCDKYSSWFILNFSTIVKKTRLTFKQLQKKLLEKVWMLKKKNF